MTNHLQPEGISKPIKVVNLLHSNSFTDLTVFFLTAPRSTFLEEMERGKEIYRYVLHGWLLSRKVFMASGKQLHIRQITERSLIIERLFSFKEQAITKRKH